MEAVPPNGFVVSDVGMGSILATTSTSLFPDLFVEWCYSRDYPPVLHEVLEASFFEMVTLPLTEHAATYLDCCSAFPAEMLLEESGPEIVDEGDRELLQAEEEMLDSLPLPHASAGEDRRRAEWS
eukprot:1683700-Amphidinium_carterae.1